MKKLEEIPSFICKEGDTNFAAYCDTDSVYIHAEPILNHLYPNFDEMEDKEKDEVLEKVALQYQDIITDYYNTLAKDCFNVDEHRLEMHTECVIRSAYFRATRRYAVHQVLPSKWMAAASKGRASKLRKVMSQ